MTIFLLSALINLIIVLTLLALILAALILALWQIKKALYSISIDLIELRGRWVQSAIDLKNNQVMADLEQKRLADEIRHRGKVLEAEAETLLLPVRRERLELLSSLDEVNQ